MRWKRLEMLFEDGVVAVAEQLLLHGDCVRPIREWTDLNVNKGVSRIAMRGCGEAMLLESADQDIGIGGVGDGGNLDHGAGWS